jgi:hypothetical protein
MKSKFSGFCYLTIKNHEIIDNENNDYSLVGEFDWVNNDIDFDYDILVNIKKDDSFNKLEDGNYYVYFTGDVDFYSTYSYEYACEEYNSDVGLDYIQYQKLEEEK